MISRALKNMPRDLANGLRTATTAGPWSSSTTKPRNTVTKSRAVSLSHVTNRILLECLAPPTEKPLPHASPEEIADNLVKKFSEPILGIRRIGSLKFKINWKPEPIKLALTDVASFEPPRLDCRHFIDVTSHTDDARYFIPPIVKRYAPMTLDVVNLKLRGRFLTAFANHEQTPFEFNLGNGTLCCFEGFVDSVHEHAPIDGVAVLKVSIRITGQTQIKQEGQKVAIPTKIRNKFYVAHPKVHCALEQARDNELVPRDFNGRHKLWTKKTLKLAIEHAEEILEQNPQQDEAYVVQIVRRVRRKKAPVIVETIK